jgi:phosphoribosylformylglycinamidine synthase
MAAECGLALDLSALPRESHLSPYQLLFSESMSRLVVTIDPRNRVPFEQIMAGGPFDMIGKVTDTGVLAARGPAGDMLLEVNVSRLKTAYKETLGW